MSSLTRTIRNGVDTDKLFATLDLIEAEPELEKFQFRAANRWLDGAELLDHQELLRRRRRGHDPLGRV